MWLLQDRSDNADPCGHRPAQSWNQLVMARPQVTIREQANLEQIALHLLGEPNRKLCHGSKLRWGRNGSLSVDLDKRLWYSHEEGVGGDAVDLVRWHTGTDYAGAFRWLEGNGLKAKTARVKPKPRPITDTDELREVVAALQMFEREYHRNPESWNRLDRDAYGSRRSEYRDLTGLPWKASAPS